MKTAGMALNVGLCNNIGKCKVKKSQLRGLGLWRRPALKSQKYGKPMLNSTKYYALKCIGDQANPTEASMTLAFSRACR